MTRIGKLLRLLRQLGLLVKRNVVLQINLSTERQALWLTIIILYVQIGVSW